MPSFMAKLNQVIKKNSSYLCVGLDTDYQKLPVKSKNIQKSILTFNKKIIDVTRDLVCSYKINSAFYEQYGAESIETLKKTVRYIGKDIPVIIDAKRCDIGNTSRCYAEYIFNYLKADAATVIPYMGIDAIEPFFKYSDKFIFTVILSSNPGAYDFQTYPFYRPLYLRVIKKINQLNTNSGFVFGATKPDYILKIRNKKINNLLLIPGIGSQGGNIDKTLKYTFMNKAKGIFNISRDIIYAGKGKKFYDAVRIKAKEYIRIIQPG